MLVPRAYAQGITFPSRSSDLSGGYWTITEFSEGCCVLDWNVQKFTDGRWKDSHEGEDFDYGVPLYAPANGEICSCWRNFPDENTDRIFPGGNHVVIKTEDNHVISLNHLKPGSIPSELCPNNSGSEVYPHIMAVEGDWRVASFIPAGSRPKVREGQLVGRVGDSGRSSGPHLHTSYKRVTGTDSEGRERLGSGLPFPYRNGWEQPYENSTTSVNQEGWRRMRGGEFSRDGGKRVINPSPFLRRGSETAGRILKADVAFVGASRFVTASVGADYRLRLDSWDLVGYQKIDKNEGGITVGEVKDVQIAKVRSDEVLVVVKINDDHLKLILFGIGPTGNIRRLDDQTAGMILDFELVRMNCLASENFVAVTAVRLKNNKLKLIAWDVTYSGTRQSIVRRGDIEWNSVSALSACKSSNFRGIYTAVRNAEGNLQVIPWKLSTNGMSFTKGKDVEAGKIARKVSIEAIGHGVCIGMGDKDNDTRIIAMESSADGNMVERKSTLVLNAVKEINLLSSPQAGSNLSAIVSDGDGDLRLIGLLMNPNGTNLRRIGTSLGGHAELIAADATFHMGPNLEGDLIITAYCNKDGNLGLTTWSVNLETP
ncbi:MAG: M23 family metallopeptidase [Saprospiraceae bacterium]